MRVVYAGLAALAASGCLTTSGGVRRIESDPTGALVTVEGYGECETPCTVRLDERRRITVAKAGYAAQRFFIAPDGPPVKVTLDLAAASDDVDAEALPEID